MLTNTFQRRIPHLKNVKSSHYASVLLRFWGFQKVQLGGLFINGISVKMASKVIVGLWKRALNNAKDYRENDEHVYLSNEETDDESFSEDNMESSE